MLYSKSIAHLFFSKLASGRNPPNLAIWLVPRAGSFLRSCPLTRAESLAALFTSLFVVCEWAKPVIFQHFSFKTCAIMSISQGKVNFVIQTKHLKGESSKWAWKTAKVKQNERLVMSLRYLFNLRCKYCNLAFMHRLFDIFPLFVGVFSIFAASI